MNNSIKLCREKAGLTQKEVALSLKVSVQSVSFWETGDRKPTLEKAILLADLCKCSLDELVGRAEIQKKLAALPGDEQDKLFLTLIHRLPQDRKDFFLDLLRGMVQQEK